VLSASVQRPDRSYEVMPRFSAQTFPPDFLLLYLPLLENATMITFQRYSLSNGLKLLVHEDFTTPMAVVNVLYDVGARDEDPSQTGFAHLFEHLMFGGSVNIPSYDEPLQRVGGENNAFTSNDITNYYVTLPASNIETALWLESDRMLGLAFSQKSLDVQRNVVCEEFKQRYLNQPYGDVWLNLRPLAYQQHPYRWATIGKELSHIENAQMDDVKAFFNRFYNPSNAILVIGGAVKSEDALALAEKWFGAIPAIPRPVRNLPAEPVQTEERRMAITADVPLNAVYMAFHAPGRSQDSYYAADLISDILSRGNSSRLFRSLVREKQIFSEINAYLTGSIDPGLFVVEGKPLPGVSPKEAELAVWEELERLKTDFVSEEELTKVKNKVESTMVFAETSLLDKAMNIAYYELLGSAEEINSEVARYIAVSESEIRERAGEIFRKENCSVLTYLASNAEEKEAAAQSRDTLFNL
jgi:zinc protease